MVFGSKNSCEKVCQMIFRVQNKNINDKNESGGYKVFNWICNMKSVLNFFR